MDQELSDPSHSSSSPIPNQHTDEQEAQHPSYTTKPSPQLLEHLNQYISGLRPTTGCSLNNHLLLHNNCYFPDSAILPSLLTPHLFRPKPSDVLIATSPKSGTTWLKALLFTTFHRHVIPYSDPNHPLTRISPHDLVPFLDFSALYPTTEHNDSVVSSHNYELFATHVPFHLLPAQEHLQCRIIYLCRDPKDSFVSLWHHVNRVRAKFGQDLLSVEEGFTAFCNGVTLMGPYWDNVIGYWKMRGEKVLFLKYEEMMDDTGRELRRVAEFVGKPFTEEEERKGVVEGIVGVCGFGSLSGLEVNKSGVFKTTFEQFENGIFFRKGKVRDWVNHISPDMGRRLDEITESKFKGTGLSF